MYVSENWNTDAVHVGKDEDKVEPLAEPDKTMYWRLSQQ